MFQTFALFRIGANFKFMHNQHNAKPMQAAGGFGLPVSLASD